MEKVLLEKLDSSIYAALWYTIGFDIDVATERGPAAWVEHCANAMKKIVSLGARKVVPSELELEAIKVNTHLDILLISLRFTPSKTLKYTLCMNSRSPNYRKKIIAVSSRTSG